MGQQVAMVIEISLWLPSGPSYHSNKICGTCLLFQETLVSNISLMCDLKQINYCFNLVAMGTELP